MFHGGPGCTKRPNIPYFRIPDEGSLCYAIAKTTRHRDIDVSEHTGSWDSFIDREDSESPLLSRLGDFFKFAVSFAHEGCKSARAANGKS